MSKTDNTAPNREPWPTDITLKKNDNMLTVTFDDGVVKQFSAKHLRANSPSAEVQGHGHDKPLVVINAHVKMTGVEPVGNYAVRILFDDGHATGLYSWNWLYGLASG